MPLKLHTSQKLIKHNYIHAGKKSTKNTDHMQHSADTHKAADVSRNPAYSITSNEVCA